MKDMDRRAAASVTTAVPRGQRLQQAGLQTLPPVLVAKVSNCEHEGGKRLQADREASGVDAVGEVVEDALFGGYELIVWLTVLQGKRKHTGNGGRQQ